MDNLDILFSIKKTVEDFQEGLVFIDPFTSKKQADLEKLREMGVIRDKNKSKNPKKNKKKRRR